MTQVRRSTFGFIFQHLHLIPNLSVTDNVMLPLVPTGMAVPEMRDRVDEALRSMRIDHRSSTLAGRISGGEQQRTAIARAMVHDPRLIIADEPTGNLDPLISWEIIQLLLRINEMGTTVLMATHDAEVVTALRRRVVALEDGRVVRDEVGGYHREY